MSWLGMHFHGDVGFGDEPDAFSIAFGDDTSAPGTPGNPINLDAVNLDIPLGDPGNLASTIDAAPAAIANAFTVGAPSGTGGGIDPMVLVVGGAVVAGLLGLLFLLPHKAAAAVVAAGAAAP